MSGDTSGSVLGASTVATAGLATLAITGESTKFIYILGLTLIIVAILLGITPIIIKRIRLNRTSR